MTVEKIENYNIHQNPATNENEFDVENYLNENWNKTKEAVNNNADELISVQEELSTLEQGMSDIEEEQIEQNTNIESLQTKLEKVEKEFNDYAIHGQETGESIHLTDSAKSTCKVDLKGNVKQETRTGKNLFNIETATLYSGTKELTSDKTGFILRKGTNRINNYALTKALQAGTYTIYFKLKIENSTFNQQNVGFSFKNSAQDNVGATVTATSNETYALKVTTDQEVSFLYCFINNGENANCVATITDFMILEGEHTIDENYERFGASPSLDYPASIQTVGSNINLIESLEFGDLSTSDGKTESRSSNFAITDYIEVEKLADYTASKNMSSQIVVYKYDQSKNYLGFENNSSISYTFETDTNIKYVRLRFATTTLDIEAKLEKGKVATSYSSFGQGSVKATSCNKNFLDLEKEVIQTKNGITASTNNENELTLNGTSTTGLFISLCENELSINTNGNNFKSKKLKKGSYTLSIEKSGETTDNNINLLIRKAEDLSSTGNISVISNIGSKASALSKFTLEQDQEVKIWLWLNTGNTLSNFKVKIQLEEGDTATEIIGNEQNSITVSIQQEMFSRFDRQNNKELHDYKKIILNGTQNFTLLTTTENYLRFQLDSNLTSDLKNGFKIHCENLKVVKQTTSSSVNEEKIVERDISNDKLLQIVILKSRLAEATAEGLKQYLATNNIIAYCELEEPIKLDLTQEQIEALEKLDEMQTYKNITNITTDSIAILDVDYKKDLETLINRIKRNAL